MLSLQNSAYPMPLYTALNNKKRKEGDSMKILNSFIIFLLLSACAMSPNINQVNDKELNISYKGSTLVSGSGKNVYTNTIHLSHITIYQTIYRMNNHYLTYEYAKASSGYKFTKGVKRSISIIFDTNAYDLEYRRGNIYFFVLHPKNSDPLYLIVENVNSSALKLVYGFDKTNYETIKKVLQKNEAIKNSKPEENMNNIAAIKNTSQYIRSKWSPKVIIMDQLVAKLIGRGPVGRK